MKFSTLLIIIICFVLLLIYFGWYYIFSIYEVVYEVTPQFLYADDQSSITIKAVPLNSLGKKAPFRNAPASIKIIEGEELVHIIKNDFENGIFILKSKNINGNVVIRIKSKYSLMPSEIKIEILKNAA